MVDSKSSAVEIEIDKKAREANFGALPIDTSFKVLMEMKIKTDMLDKQQQRTSKDLAILYRRFIVNSQDLVMPMLHAA